MPFRPLLRSVRFGLLGIMLQGRHWVHRRLTFPGLPERTFSRSAPPLAGIIRHASTCLSFSVSNLAAAVSLSKLAARSFAFAMSRRKPSALVLASAARWLAWPASRSTSSIFRALASKSSASAFSLAVFNSPCASANCLARLKAIYVARTVNSATRAPNTKTKTVSVFHQSTLLPKSCVRRTRDWIFGTFSPSEMIALLIVLCCAVLCRAHYLALGNGAVFLIFIASALERCPNPFGKLVRIVRMHSDDRSLP